MRNVVIACCLCLAAALPGAALKDAPAFKGKDIHGKVWTEKSPGYVLVDFWASWCLPCLKEIPALNTLYDRHQAEGKFALLGICLDEGGSKAARAAAAKNMIHYPVAPGSAALADAFGINGFPTAVLLKDGKVVKLLAGERNLAAFERDLAPYLQP